MHDGARTGRRPPSAVPAAVAVAVVALALGMAFPTVSATVAGAGPDEAFGAPSHEGVLSVLPARPELRVPARGTSTSSPSMSAGSLPAALVLLGLRPRWSAATGRRLRPAPSPTTGTTPSRAPPARV